MMMIVWLSALCLIALVNGKPGFGDGDQDYGYVTVRPGAHMFWWLYYTTADVKNTTERPLILWLQGGPGGSSTGIGNFEIMGPLDSDLKPRNYTWVKNFNVLYVDNPVGSGFSYVEDSSLLTTDNQQIARDLVTMLKYFYEKLPQFKSIPLYVYGESYGGKMAVEFVELLIKEVHLGNIKSNISGVAMGDSWIHPIYSTLSWAKYLYQFGLVDISGTKAIYEQALRTQRAFNERQYEKSTDEWRKTQLVVINKTVEIDFYNVLNKRRPNQLYNNTNFIKLSLLMNERVKKALGIPNHVKWIYGSSDVFNNLKSDFMKPVTHIVERLLNETRIKVHVYNGNLDLIVDTPGTIEWVNRLRWPDYLEYRKNVRQPIWIDNVMEGYEKSGGKFTFFWINVAGHMVPADNPAGGRYLLKSMTGF